MSTLSKKPFTLIVPGGMTPAAVYDPVVAEVTRRGHDIRAVQLPSVRLRSETGPVREPPTMYEDAALIAKEAEALADAGRDVIIISHSYGGVPATESVRGLSKAARAKEGKPGGVVRLAYMTSLVPELGVAANDVLTNRPRAAGPSAEMDMDVSYDLMVSSKANPDSIHRITHRAGTRLDLHHGPGPGRKPDSGRDTGGGGRTPDPGAVVPLVNQLHKPPDIRRV